jgi:aspartyl/asparaginyl-tRNA synthetase
MSKKARKEGNRVAVIIKANNASFFVSDVDLDDNINDVVVATNLVRKTLGKLKSSFMILSGGTKVLTAIVDVPKEKQDIINAKSWLEKSLININGEVQIDKDSNGLYAKGIVNMEFPFKFIDTVRANAFNYLRQHSLLEDDESSEGEFLDFNNF